MKKIIIILGFLIGTIVTLKVHAEATECTTVFTDGKFVRCCFYKGLTICN